MGLNTSTSFATGGAASAGPVAMTQIWLSSQNTTAILYTVPSGKYFKGYVGHSYNSYPKVNGVAIHSYWNNAFTDNYASAASNEIILCAGSTVQASNNNGNWLLVLGVEYDIPTSGTTSGIAF